MAGFAQISLERMERDSNKFLKIKIAFLDSSFNGNAAVYSLVALINANALEKELFRREFTITQTEEIFEIPEEQIEAYSYKGKKINIKILSRLRIKKVLLDKTVEQEEKFDMGKKPEISSDPYRDSKIVAPADTYNFKENFKRLPRKNKFIVFFIIILSVVLIALNIFIGAHDEVVSVGDHYFYCRSCGQTRMEPLVMSLVISGIIALVSWFAIRRQLRRYINAKLKPLPDKIGKTDKFKVCDFFSATAKIDIEEIELVMVACNVEKMVIGAGKRKSYISAPVRALTLFEKKVSFIPAGMEISAYFNDDFSFEKLFETLYPRFLIDTKNGIDVRWAILLKNKSMLDTDLKGREDIFKFKDFAVY